MLYRKGRLNFRFCLLTAGVERRERVVRWLPGLAKGGLRALQIRERDLAASKMLEYCRQWRKATLEYDADLHWWVNNQIEVALKLGWASVHLPEGNLPLSVTTAAKLSRLGQWSCAVHDAAGLKQAWQCGAAFVLLGPIFATTSKPGHAGLGMQRLETLCKQAQLPVIALGGITPQRAKDCLNAGASGVAAISAIWDAPQPAEALAAFEKNLGSL